MKKWVDVTFADPSDPKVTSIFRIAEVNIDNLHQILNAFKTSKAGIRKYYELWVGIYFSLLLICLDFMIQSDGTWEFE